jgi:hypothetical protein
VLFSLLANRQSTKITTHTICCIYIYIYSIPPDDGIQICPKHEEVDSRNKLRINRVSSWFSLHGCTEINGQQNIKSGDLPLRQLLMNQSQFDLTAVNSVISPTVWKEIRWTWSVTGNIAVNIAATYSSSRNAEHCTMPWRGMLCIVVFEAVTTMTKKLQSSVMWRHAFW